MDSGAYASNVELAEAGQHERMQLAQALWYLKHDLSDEAWEQGYLSCMDTLRGGGFPDETARLAEQLTNTDFRETLSGEFTQFYAAHEQDRSLLRFHYHKLENIWQSLRDLSLPRREYSSEMAAVPELGRFITEDEIDHALDRGSGVEGGKSRIYEYFTADHTGKEKAAFLKDEYGIGGRSHAVSGASHSDESHDSRGIVLKKAGCANVELSWTKVAARIDSLIQKDRFLSPREKERYYSMATKVSKDFRGLAFSVQKSQKTRFRQRLKTAAEVEKNRIPCHIADVIKERYGKSKQLRYVGGIALAPIGYVKHRHPIQRKRGVNSYTAEGRAMIHKQLEAVDMEILHYLMRNPVWNATIEYNDNRLSLYSAQMGKCAVTGAKLMIGDIFCHHKVPRCNGGTDAYQNLILLCGNAHRLIHATDTDTIARLTDSLNLTPKQKTKVDKLRSLVHVESC